MRYVLDSSVAVKWFLAEQDSDKAISVRDDFARGVHELLSPDVFPAEAAHAITRAERQLRITQAERKSHFRDMLSTLPALYAHLPLLPRAYELSSQARIGVYDCLYVALAERERCEVLTADDRMKRSLPGGPIVLLAAMP
ncbi:MAG: type II toxin-antitoxin system VapC family toxin [Isosphaeraceae bacterium]